MAAAVHGYPRATTDIDLLFRKPLRDARKRLSDRGIDAVLKHGDALAGELGRQLEGGRQVLAQLAQITLAARPAQNPPAPEVPQVALPDAQATAQAAAAFAARARQRLSQAA